MWEFFCFWRRNKKSYVSPWTKCSEFRSISSNFSTISIEFLHVSENFVAICQRWTYFTALMGMKYNFIWFHVMIFYFISNDSRRIRIAQHEIICNIYHWFGLLFARSFALTHTHIRIRSMWSTFHRKDQQISVAGHKNASWRNKKVWRKEKKREEKNKKHEDKTDAHISVSAVQTISYGCVRAIPFRLIALKWLLCRFSSFSLFYFFAALVPSSHKRFPPLDVRVCVCVCVRVCQMCLLSCFYHFRVRSLSRSVCVRQSHSK